MDSPRVEISRSVLGLLVGGLVLSLVLLAFLLGRESTRPVVDATPSVAAAAPVAYADGVDNGSEISVESGSLQRAPSGLPTHYRSRSQSATEAPAPDSAALPTSVEPASSESQPESTSYPKAKANRVAPKTSAPTGTAPAPVPETRSASPQQAEETRKYLAQIDQALVATPSLSDPNSFATQLLGQSMTGDTSGFDILLTEARGTLSRLQAIRPPSHCQEHHSLNIKQLQTGIALLGKVKDATQGMDTAALSQLSLQGHAMQSEIVRLQQIDQELRASIR